MKTLAILVVSIGLLMGCASAPSTDFVQGNIIITPPIQLTKGVSPFAGDGGTLGSSFTDAKGQFFPFFIDHRIDTKTPGAIYLMAYPDDPGSVLVLNEKQFRQKLDWNVKP